MKDKYCRHKVTMTENGKVVYFDCNDKASGKKSNDKPKNNDENIVYSHV